LRAKLKHLREVLHMDKPGETALHDHLERGYTTVRFGRLAGSGSAPIADQ
jgi:hypothetical protein